MSKALKSFKTFFSKMFTKTRKIVELPQGKEYESWLGI